MTEQDKLEHAKSTFNTLCKIFDKNEWHYEKNEEKLSISCQVRGDDLPMKISMRVHAERMLAILLSHMPFVIQEDKRLDVAIAVSVINNVLVDGCFDYDISSGRMLFRMTNSFLESKLSEDVFEYMFFCACKTIDEYNDRFLMLSKGMISLEQFISMCAN